MDPISIELQLIYKGNTLNKLRNNKEAMWLYAELFLGIWNVQKCQNVQILKLLGVFM